jgi:hypothetical protein
MNVLILAVVVGLMIFCATIGAAFKAKKASGSWQYSLRPALLSPAEIELDTILRRAVPELTVCPKVRVADVISAKRHANGDFLRISQKHFDWVLCEPKSFLPLVALELDDSSHSRNQRTKNSDDTKNRAAASAGLKLLRIRWSTSYDENRIREDIAALINA